MSSRPPRNPLRLLTFARYCAFLILAGALADAGATADYAREERWAQEIVPSLVVGDVVYLATVTRSRVLAILTLPSGKPKGGVVVVHGLGVHPDWGLIGGLRTRLADAGFATLSVQMPVLSANATRGDYRETLPEAGDRIAAAIAYLHVKDIAKIAIVSHSMGATMANVYLARPNAYHVDAWIPVGMFATFAAPPREALLDILAENDFTDVLAAAPRRASVLRKDGCSKQVTIEGADHYFDSRQPELAATIAMFLDRAFAGLCSMAVERKS